MTEQYRPGEGVDGRPRLTFAPFPPYSYVSRNQPHPVTDPNGHMYRDEVSDIEPLDLAHWKSCQPYLHGIDLFNHGYYWEAHETWEGLWIATGRSGPIADFLKGLIKLAAAAVKAREGNAIGVTRHAQRARELLTIVAASELPVDGRVAGLSTSQLREMALDWQMDCEALANRADATRLFESLPPIG